MARPKRSRRRLVVLLSVLLLLVGAAVGMGALMLSMPGKSHRGPLPALRAEQAALREALRADLQRLSVDIGERNLRRYAKLREAADLVASAFEGAGLAVSRQTYTCRGYEVDNVIGELPGRSPEIVVVGGHYDTVVGCPGANDNGTGVVATMALARAFAGTQPERTLRFLGFVNEEPPYFQTEEMGSLVYAKACRERGDRIAGMLSLETIGYYDDGEKTQQYPFPLGLLYPSTGNFVSFVGNFGSRRLVRRAVGAFRAHAAFPSEGGAAPSSVPGIGWSDHWAFWQVGYDALMVTDTAPFRHDDYHTPLDTVERIDFDGFARVVDGLRYVVADLAGIELPEGEKNAADG